MCVVVLSCDFLCHGLLTNNLVGTNKYIIYFLTRTFSRSLPLARNAAIEAPGDRRDLRREPLVSTFPGDRLETRELI